MVRVRLHARAALSLTAMIGGALAPPASLAAAPLFGAAETREGADPSLQRLKERATAGEADAQLALGSLYDIGRGVPQDATMAFDWYRRAAEHGQPEAQLNVGVMYDSGRGVARDTAQAALWYARAAVRGNRRAQYNIASLYAVGEGVPRNIEAARAWYRTAAGGGLSAAADRLGALERSPAPPPPALPSAGGAPPLPVAARPLPTLEPRAAPGDRTLAVELAWDAPPQAMPTQDWVQIVALGETGQPDVFVAAVETTAVLALLPPVPAHYAWRVYTTERAAAHYVASPWVLLTIGNAADENSTAEIHRRPM